MANLASIQGNFKQRYGRWIEPLPDEHTLADFGNFIPGENRPGLGYNFPVLTGWEHGQTANTDGSAFSLLGAVDSQVINANLDGATIVLQSNISYDVVFKSLNGTGQGSMGGAYKTALDQSVQALLLGGGLYRELALAYGPGGGSTLASNIGVVNSIITGANLSAGQTLTLTTKSWIPGLWVVGIGMVVDVYASDGSTARSLNCTVTARPSSSQTRLTLSGGGTAATAVVGDLIIPRGWRTKSCVGLEAIYNNSGTLFGINAGLVAPWLCGVFSAGNGKLTRALVMGFAAQIATNGTKNGGRLFVSAPTFADLAEEFNQFQRYNRNNDRSKTIGSSEISYDTSAGVIEVVVYQYAKLSQAFFIANDNFRRVGSSDLTMRPIYGGQEGFLINLPDKAGLQLKIFSNQAPVFEMPYRNFLVNNIVNTYEPSAS